MSWTDERIATLKRLWEEGLTASQIAETLGAVTRNAVIGKAHRLGLKSRPSPVKSNDDSAAASVTPPTPPQAAPAAEPAAPPRTPAAPKPRATAASTPKPAPSPAAPPPPPPPPAAPSEPSEVPSQPFPGAAPASTEPKLVSIGPGGFIRQGPGDQQAPIPPAPPRRRVPAKPAPEIADKTSLLDLNDRICRWPMGHPGEPDFHFCGEAVNPGYPYCVDHCGRAFQAQLPRGTRRPPPPPFGGPRVR